MTLHLAFVLAPRASGELQNRARQATARGGRPTLSRAEFLEKHAPLQSDYDKLKDYLGAAQGVKVVKTSGARGQLFIEASVADVETLLSTTINSYDFGGRQFFANATDPKLPDGIAQLIQSITGLQNGATFRPHAHPVNPRSGGGAPGFTPSDIRSAYDIATLISRGDDGTGATIGIVSLASFNTSDVRQFESQYGLPQASLSVIPTNDPQTPGCSTAGSDETTVDVEWASAVAPKAAIKAFIGSDNCDLVGALEAAVSDTSVDIISLSWGACEANYSANDRTAVHNLMSQAAAAGKSVLVASGDSGSGDTPCVNGGSNVDYPASDPFVTAVGGTSLSIDANSVWTAETGWSGSGGGCSTIWNTNVSWQSGASTGCGGFRAVPDVSANADPATAYAFYCSCTTPHLTGVGGTSVSAPLWAGVIADLNRGRERSGVGSPKLGFANTALYGLSTGTAGTTPFHDITTGSNGFTAGAGWDKVTGMGSPDVKLMAAALGVTGTAPSAPQSVTASAGDAEATVSWTAPATDGGAAITSYTVAANPGTVGPVTVNAPTTTVLITGLTDSTAYTFTVTAYNGSTSPASAPSPPVTPKAGTAQFLPGISVLLAAGQNGTGSANGSGSAALFSGPTGLAVGPSGKVYVADSGNNSIRVLTCTPTCAATTLVTGLSIPSAVATDASENVYVTEAGANDVKKYSSAGSLLTTYSTGFHSPRGVAVDSSGNIYVSNWSSTHDIKKIDTSNTVSTLAGSGTATFADGTGAAASFNQPRGLALDGSGNLYVADEGNNRIRKIVISSQVVTTVAGSGPGFVDGSTSVAQFNAPGAVSVDTATGNIYVADAGNNRIRRISGTSANTVAGTGVAGTTETGSSAQFSSPDGAAWSSSAGVLFASNQGTDNSIRKITFSATPGPAKPTNVKGVPIGNNQVLVSWTPGNDGGSTQAFSITDSSNVSYATGLSASTTSYTISGLTPFTAYTFTVTADNGHGTAASTSFSPSNGVVPAPVAITGDILAGTTPISAVGSGMIKLSCAPTGSGACNSGFYRIPGDGTFTYSTNPGRYDFYVPPSSANTSGYNSTGPAYVDASVNGAYGGVHIPVVVQQYNATSLTLSGQLTDATHTAPNGVSGSVTVGIPSNVFPGSLDNVSTATDASGNYSMGIAPGTYIVTAIAASDAASLPVSVQVTTASVVKNFTLGNAPTTITVNVKDGSNNNLSGISLNYSCISTSASAGCNESYFSDVTDASGNTTFYANPGKYDISVKPGAATGYNSHVATLVDTATVTSPVNLVVYQATTTLSGLVADVTGRGIGGATVQIGFSSNVFSGGFESKSITTNTDGTYSLAVAPGISYLMNAGAPGYPTTTTETVDLSGAGATFNKNFTLTAAPVTVTGFVKDGVGTPIAGATLSTTCSATTSASCDAGVFASRMTAADGSFTAYVARGRFDFFVGPGAGNGYNSVTPTFVDASTQTNVSGVNVVVAQTSAVLTGTVTTNGTTPVSGAVVSIGIPSIANNGSFDYRRLLTDASGNYSVAIAPGDYTLTVTAAGVGGVGNTTVTVPTGGPVNFNLGASPTVTITGQVLNDGTPVPNATLTYDCSGTNCHNAVFASSTDSSGNFTFYAMSPATYNLFVRPGSPSGFNSLYATQVTVSGSNLSNQIVFVSPETTTLSGTVKDASSNPVPGALVNIGIPSFAASTTFLYRSVSTDSAGHYALGLAPGTYQVYATDGTLSTTPTLLTVAGATETENFMLVSAAATLTWNGCHSNGAFSDPLNWTPNGVPGATSALVIAPSGCSGVVFQGTGTVGSITIQNGGLLSVLGSGASPSTLTVTNGITNQGQIDLANYPDFGGGGTGGATLSLPGSSLANNGSIVSCSRGIGGAMGCTASFIGAIQGSVISAGPITANANLSITLGGGTFTNNGTLTVASGATVNISGGSFTNFASQTLTGGTYNVGGTLQFDNAFVRSIAANVTLDGASSAINDQNNLDAVADLTAITTGGGLTIQNGRSLSTSGPLTNNGQLTIGYNSSLSLGNGSAPKPAVVLNTPTPTPNLTVAGSFTQTGSGTLNMALGGTTAGLFSTISAGTATLDGTLNVTFANGFTPVLNNAFQILGYGSRTGTFTVYTPVGYPFSANYGATNLTLAAGTSGPVTATFTVNTTADLESAGACVAHVPNQCSLREAIDETNSAPAGSTITITVPAGQYNLNGPLVITLTASSSLTINGTGWQSTIISGQNANRVLWINPGTVTLNGLTIQFGNTGSGGGSNIFNNGGILAINNSVISGGFAGGGYGGAGIFNGTNFGTGPYGALSLNATTVWSNTAAVGGGIFNDSGGSVTISNGSVISYNQTTSGAGGGVFSRSGTLLVTTGSAISNNTAGGGYPGGGIYSESVNGGTATVTIDASTVTTNHADKDGGAIYQAGTGGTLTIKNGTTIGSNTAVNGPEGGGGIHNEAGNTVAIQSGSTVSGNTASCATCNGGGVLNYGALTLDGSTIGPNNSASNSGGGIYNANTGTASATNTTISGNSAAGAGAVDNQHTLTLTNSTVSGNHATNGRPGGIYNAGTLTVTNSTFSGNTSAGNTGTESGGAITSVGTLTVTSATIAGNSAAHGAGGVAATTGTLANTILASNSGGNCDGAVTDGGYNLSDDASCGAIPANGLVTSKLGSLQNNGGPTQTVALLAGSPAIDAIPLSGPACSNGVPATDQRGITRPQGIACDIGAFEAPVPPPVTISGHVLNNAGPVASALVRYLIQPGGGGGAFCCTDSSGLYTITGPLGTYELWATAPGANSTSSILVTGTTAGTFTTGTDISVTTAVTVSGAVLDGGTQNGVYAAIQFSLPSQLYPGSSDFITFVTTDGSGNYTAQLAPGTYSALVFANGYPDQRPITVTIGGPTTGLNFRLFNVPGAPSNVTAVGGEGLAVLSWTAPASNGGSPIHSYTIYSDPPMPTNASRPMPWVATGTASTTYVVTGLSNNTAYTFRVAAFNDPAGEGPPSASASPVTPSAFTRTNASAGLRYGFQAESVLTRSTSAVNLTSGAGFTWLKQQVRWSSLQGCAGCPLNAADIGALDALATSAHNNGVNLLFSVTSAPDWAASPGGHFPANNQDFANFMAALATRYQGKVQAYEIWNEQNLAAEVGAGQINAGNYVELLKAAYTIIKAIDPGAVVVSGGMAPTGVTSTSAVDDLDYLSQMYAYQGGVVRNYFDALGAHNMPYNNPPEDTVASHTLSGSYTLNHSFFFRTAESYHTTMVNNGDGNKPIWETEFGYDANDPANLASFPDFSGWTVTEQQQADYLVRAFNFAKTNWPWIGPIFVWNLNFQDVVSINDQKWGFAVTHSDGSPRPAYTALQQSAPNPNVISVVLSTLSLNFSGCTSGNSPPDGTKLGTPNGQCQTGLVAVSVNGSAGAVLVQATNAVPADNGTPWTLCGAQGDTSCTTANPGIDQFRLQAVDNNNKSSVTTLGHSGQCDQAFGCAPASNTSRQEYLQVTGPASSTDKSATFTTTISWTATS